MSTTETEPFIVVEDGVLSITIATAAKGGSLNFDDGIRPGLAALRDLDTGIGAILLGGSGANFCNGGDVRAFAAAPDRGEYVRGLATDLHDFVRALRDAPVPVVAGVQGWAAGAGMSLVCAADISIGGPSTKLVPAYPGIGFTPDGGMSWLLPRLVGVGRAREILLTNATVAGEEAVRLGILSRLVGDDVVGEEALRVARTLSTGPRSANAGIKALLGRSESTTLSEQLDLERDAIALAANSPGGVEGVDAFNEKRRPNFAGR